MFQKLIPIIVKLLIKNGFYYAEDADFHHQRQKYKVMILAKETYFETVKHFPFSSLKDIRTAVLADVLEYAPFMTDYLLLRKTARIEEKTTVNLWFVKRRAADLIATISPLVVIPETVLFCFNSGKPPFSYHVRKNEDCELFVYVDNDTTVKSLEFQLNDATQPSLVENFHRICGKPPKIPEKTLSGARVLSRFLEDRLYTMPIGDWAGFINKAAYGFNAWGKLALRYAIIGFALFIGYSGISAWMLHKKHHELETIDKKLTADSSALMEKSGLLEERIERFNQLKKLISGYQPRTNIIRAVLTIAPDGTKIQKLIIAGDMVEIEGTALDAAGLMQALSRWNDFINARFTSPLSKDPKTGRDRFKLSFVILGSQGDTTDATE